MKKNVFLVIVLFILSGCSNKEYSNGVINVLNWSSYIPGEVINNFEKEYDIKVNYATYSSNEELLAKVTNSKMGTYDLVFPSDYMVELMVKKDLLEFIDKEKLVNFKNIDPIFLNQNYDYGNKYSLPFLMTYVVIAFDKSKISDNIRGYNDLLNTNYKNNMVLLDDQRIVIGMGLNSLKYDINDLNINNYNLVKEFFLRLKDNVKVFDSDSPKSFLIIDEVDLGVMWNAEALLAQKYNSNIEIVVPSDGYAISVDNYCILRGSKNADNIYKFMDYLLSVNVNKKIVDSYPYISSISENNLYDRSYIKTILDNGSYIKNVGYDIKYYDTLWAEIK